MEAEKGDDEQRRDEVLKRMLRTPPKPHKPKRDEGEGREKQPPPRDDDR